MAPKTPRPQVVFRVRHSTPGIVSLLKRTTVVFFSLYAALHLDGIVSIIAWVVALAIFGVTIFDYVRAVPTGPELRLTTDRIQLGRQVAPAGNIADVHYDRSIMTWDGNLVHVVELSDANGSPLFPIVLNDYVDDPRDADAIANFIQVLARGAQAHCLERQIGKLAAIAK